MKNSLQIDDLPFTKTEPVILALSGGIDSMVLFNYLINNNYNVVVCHVNHGKREASQLEEKYIKEMCINLKVKCEISHFKTNNKQNFQDEAHTYRYNFFYDTAIKYNASYILTAHQANDLAETCLLRLIKGECRACRRIIKFDKVKFARSIFVIVENLIAALFNISLLILLS